MKRSVTLAGALLFAGILAATPRCAGLTLRSQWRLPPPG